MEDKHNIDRLFEQARMETPEASFSEVKTAFVNQVESGVSSPINSINARLFTLKNGLIMFSFITAVVALSIWMLSPTNPTTKLFASTPELGETTPSKKRAASPALTAMETKAPSPIIPLETLGASDIASTPLIDYEWKPPGTTTVHAVADTVKYDSIYVFPVLTPKEVEVNEKQKRKMLRNLLKHHKSKYAYIPAGTFTSQGKDVSVQAFYMQTTEVTVLEYRTFLFDLLIQGRKEDFLTAKPQQDLWYWVKGNYWKGMSVMEEHYFSHPAYNNYPINNISRKGAELYCRWITEEAMELDKGKFINDVRLPSYYEWKYAASCGGKFAPYPWGGPAIENAMGCFLTNCWMRGEPYQKDTTDNACGDDKFPNAITTCGYELGGGYSTSPVDSYSPNDFGLYNMSGNVAEMVVHHNAAQTAASLGGGWLDNAENIKIDSKNEFEGVLEPNLNIGFRVVISYLRK